jgi:uncharacterized SAM-binding protein YcdF (DUF218 family)
MALNKYAGRAPFAFQGKYMMSIPCLTARLIIFTVLLCLTLVILPSFPVVRNLLSASLVVHDQNARGDACYVLAGGGALRERLDAAADLVQMGRVSRIYLMHDTKRGQYSFKTNSSWTRTEWATDYLAWRGISADTVSWIPQADNLFGTLKEARAVAKNLPKDVKTLVIVSSTPHMRRSVLAFKRSLPADVTVIPYAATEYVDSFEMHHPIWIEYLKLLVYFVIA